MPTKRVGIEAGSIEQSMEGKMIYPEINLNGTDGNNLLDAYKQAYHDLDEALASMAIAMPHARDYQTHEYPEAAYSKARNDHVEMMMNVRAAKDAMQQIMHNLYDQLEERLLRKEAPFSS